MEDKKSPRFTDPMGKAAGRFSTLINIGHTAEFFALDFRNLTPEGEACLLGRYFLTPSHAKRLLAALEENVKGFEAQFGPIGMIEPPPSEPTN